MGAPWEGRWVDDKRCAADPETADCLDEHLFETVYRGDRLIGTYLRTNARFKENSVPDGARWFNARVRGNLVAGQKTTYFPLARTGDCGQMQGKTSMRGELSDDGTTLTLDYSRQQVKKSDCSIQDADASSKTYYRVGPPPEEPVASPAQIAAAADHPFLPVIDPSQCPAWVELRDGPLAAGMEERLEAHEAFASLNQLEKSRAELEGQNLLLDQVRSDRSEIGRAATLDAVWRSIDGQCTVLLDLLSVVNPAAKGVNLAAKGARCLTVTVKAAVQQPGRSLSGVADELAKCRDSVIDEAIYQAAHPVIGPATAAVKDLVKMVFEIRESQQKYDEILDPLDELIERTVTQIGRVQAARDAAAEAAMEFHRTNDLVQHIDAVCGH